jgi:hypothetical protein
MVKALDYALKLSWFVHIYERKMEFRLKKGKISGQRLKPPPADFNMLA